MSSVKTPADLLSAVPFLIGYHPENSLVLISVKDDALAMAMRVDFPEAELKDGASELLANHLVRDKAESALIVGYVNSDNTNAEAILNQVADQIRFTNINVREVMLVKDNRWRSLICNDLTCCPENGSELPDFASAQITAEQVAQGKILPFHDNAQLVASLASFEVSTEPKFMDQISFLVKENTIGELSMKPDFVRANVPNLLVIKEMFAKGQPIDNDLKAQVIAVMQDIQARDFALGCFNDDEAGMALALYTDLYKTAPKDFAYPLATLASAFAYETGNGALAHRLLDKAIEVSPDYSLARLLRRVFSSGWPVEGFSQLRKELHPRVTATIFGSAE